MYVRFIDSDYIKENTTIDKNVDASFIEKFIDVAQDVNIVELVGENLYNKLMSDIIGNTLTGYYKTLVDDYIMKCQAWWVKYHSLSEMNYHLTNKGIQVKNSEYSQPAEDKIIAGLRADTLSIIRTYEDRTRLFIVRNSNHFPEYYTTSQIGEIQPQNNHLYGGLYLP